MGTEAYVVRELAETVPLVDHHVHGAFARDPSPERFGAALNEADTSLASDPFAQLADSQLGVALRRHASEVLGLPRHVTAREYWARRQEVGDLEATRRFLSAAGVKTWLVDTGFGSGELLSPSGMAEASGASAREILRLETLAEDLIARLTVEGAVSGYADAFRASLTERLARNGAVATKTVVAYRAGFDIDLSRPSDGAVRIAAEKWAADHELAGLGGRSAGPRLIDPVLLAFGIHCAIDAGRPLQLHVGFGDRDLDLRRANPLQLLPLLRDPKVQRVPVLLLHCYPYEREAGYLAQAFANVHLDVGLATTHLGVGSRALIARSLELAPFTKLLYSSDAWGPAELHFLGARLWRSGMAWVLGEWVDADDWSRADAQRVIELVAHGNAERVYGI